MKLRTIYFLIIGETVIKWYILNVDVLVLNAMFFVTLNLEIKKNDTCGQITIFLLNFSQINVKD